MAKIRMEKVKQLSLFDVVEKKIQVIVENTYLSDLFKANWKLFIKQIKNETWPEDSKRDQHAK